jgi:23S rRNA G2445 N2-methylase RlmL
MQIFTRPSRIIITCNKRLAPYLQQEVEALGFTVVRPFITGIEIKGTVNDCIRLNLNLRCASQVMYSLSEFNCNSVDELYKNLYAVPWENLIPTDGYFSVSSNVYHPSINNEMFANVKVKDAIADRMREKTGGRPHSGPHLLDSVVYLYWKDNIAEIFVDTSGETLAKHGYRKIPGKAPMMEALAASTLLATKWDRRSPFVNPMCGSGTLAIEAALIATNRAPGLYRNNYGFMHILGYDEAVYKSERQRLTDQITELPELIVVATDISDDAIEVSKVNAGIAGVEKYIQFAVCDFEATEVPQEVNGVVMFNPEYGERLGEEVELQATYARMGDFMKKKCRGYTGYVFTGNLALAKKIGLKASRRIEFYTGKIDCRLFEYELYQGSRRTEKPVE